MKKNFLLLCDLFLISALFSCSDENTIGSSILPDKDKITVAYDTVHLNTETVYVDSVFLRNSVAMLGEFTDHTFGTTKSDFMAQLYCARNFHFPNDVNQIDSAYMYFYYSNWFGDSTTIHHIKVFELNSPLNEEKTFFSNTNPADYCNQTKLLGQGSFTTGDFYSTDSVMRMDTYSKRIRIPIDISLGKRFLDDSRANPSDFATPENFQKYFKGIYVTTDYGNGSIVYITQAQIELCFETWTYSKNTVLPDTFVIGGAYFPITNEVKQINRAEHPDLSAYINTMPSDSLNYIYAPGGMFTKVTIPEKIFTKDQGILSGKTISSLRLKVQATQLNDEWDYALAPPEALLLINAAEAQTFFMNFDLNDGVTSFLAQYDSSTKNYVFDLSVYAQKMIHTIDGTGTTTNFTPFTNMLIIPVSIVTDKDGDQIRLEHLITPAAVKIRGGNHPTEPMRLEIVYSKSAT